jgi:hypothetical protein
MTLLFLTACSALEISTDRQVYSPLEEGSLTLYVDVPEQFQRVIIEIEILDSQGHMVYGDIMHSHIPEVYPIQSLMETHTSISWQEVPEGGKVYRDFPFVIPGTAADGEYMIAARVLYEDTTFDSSTTNISITGSLPVLGGFEIILILALIIGVVICKEV